MSLRNRKHHRLQNCTCPGVGLTVTAARDSGEIPTLGESLLACHHLWVWALSIQARRKQPHTRAWSITARPQRVFYAPTGARLRYPTHRSHLLFLTFVLFVVCFFCSFVLCSRDKKSDDRRKSTSRTHVGEGWTVIAAGQPVTQHKQLEIDLRLRLLTLPSAGCDRRTSHVAPRQRGTPLHSSSQSPPLHGLLSSSRKASTASPLSCGGESFLCRFMGFLHRLGGRRLLGTVYATVLAWSHVLNKGASAVTA